MARSAPRVVSQGTGLDRSPAEAVAAEIVAAGGEAVAHIGSVAEFDTAAAMVRTAIAAFGDLHIVVNNAGILRDRMLVSMSEQDFDDVVAVHLKGTFNVTRHAAAWWRERSKAGHECDRAIVNTSSSSGLHGNPGQSNYAAAKAGIAAFTLVNAVELRKYGVRANCIAPAAHTRLTDITPGLGEAVARNPLFAVYRVSPLVAYLATADCPFTGQVFSVYGDTVGIYQGWSVHSEIAAEDTWTVSELAAAMTRLPHSVPTISQQDSIVRRQAGSVSTESAAGE